MLVFGLRRILFYYLECGKVSFPTGVECMMSDENGCFSMYLGIWSNIPSGDQKLGKFQSISYTVLFEGNMFSLVQ